ncbi:zinc knuckle CX2CX4HX4C containing protein, partial [Tanacetum coccineum]
AGLEAVLEGCFWLIRKSSIILKKWSMDTRLLKEELTRIPIWVKLHNVPIQVFEEDDIKADLVDAVTIGIPSLTRDGFTKETIRVDPPIVTTSNVVTLAVEKTNDEEEEEEDVENVYDEAANLFTKRVEVHLSRLLLVTLSN